MRVLLALACLLPLAFGATFEWKGANTNWNEKSNWKGTVPSDACPANIDLTGDSLNLAIKPVITSRLDGEFFAGGSVKFPSNGRVILANNAKIKFDPDCSGSAAVFVGGMTNTKANSLNCKSNYFVAGAPSKRTPCEGDVIVIPADRTVRVWASERVNVDGIKFGATTFDTCIGISADSAVSSQLLPGVKCGRDGNFLIKDTQPCVDAKQVDEEGTCVCFENPECLTAEELRLQAQLEREAAEILAIEARDKLSANVTKTFTGTFSANSLGVTAEDLLLIKGNPDALAAFILELRKKLADAWGVPLDQVQITEFTISDDGLSVSIKGTITAPKSSLIGPDQSPDDVVDGVIELSGAQVTQLQKIIRDTVGQTILEETRSIYEEMIEQKLAVCGTSAECVAAKEALDLLSKIFVDPAKAFDAIKSCPDSACIQTEFDNNSELVKQKGVTQENIDSLVNSLNALLPYSELVDNFLDEASDVATKANAAAARESKLPADTTLRSPNIEVGQNRPRTDLAHIISTVNAPTLRFALKFALSPFLIIKRINSTSVTFSLKFNPRRGISDSDLPSVIVTNFDYTASCVAGDEANCGFKAKSDDATYVDVQKRINDVIDAFEITSHSKCYDFQTGYDAVCLQKEADLVYANAIKAGKTPAQALELAKTSIVQITECGDHGRKPDGTCVDKDTTAAINAATLASKAQTNYVPNGQVDESTGGGGGGLNLGIIAGAAGGGALILIIIIIVVVRRRGNNGGSKKNAEDRTVVAFENPMYDDPGQNTNSQYESTEAHGSEGLYDEPAYNAHATLAKSNPMYESTENIAGGDGYLATGGEEGGYLDVAPDQ